MLLAQAKLVEGERTLIAWDERRRMWQRKCAGLLGREFEQEALEEFLYATSEAPASGDSWRNTMQRQLRQLENALELVVSLRGTLERGVEGRRAAARRARRDETLEAQAPVT